MIPFDLRPLLSWGFWFSPRPVALLPFFERAFLALFLAVIVAAVVLRVFERRASGKVLRTTFAKLRRLSVVFGILGLLLLFFVYERVPYLSARVFFALLSVGVIVRAFFIVRSHRRVAPQAQATRIARDTFKKYLP